MISIIIPVYNVAPYLGQCLESVHRQTYTDWECLLIDDGSTDTSGEICDEWAKKDTRFHVVHQQNGGVSKARNAGIDNAKGEYIVFVDSDDWIEPEHLSNLVVGKDSDLVVAGVKHVYSNNKIEIKQPKSLKSFQIIKENIHDYVYLNREFLLYAPYAKLFHTSIIKNKVVKFQEECSYGEDLLFNIQYLYYANNIFQVTDSSYFYRHSVNSLSTRRRPDQFRQDYDQWCRLRDFYIKKGMWLQPSKELLYERLWGIVYDGVFDRSIETKAVLAIDEIKELKQYQHVFHCSYWIKWCILHKISFIFR